MSALPAYAQTTNNADLTQQIKVVRTQRGFKALWRTCSGCHGANIARSNHQSGRMIRSKDEFAQELLESRYFAQRLMNSIENNRMPLHPVFDGMHNPIKKRTILKFLKQFTPADQSND